MKTKFFSLTIVTLILALLSTLLLENLTNGGTSFALDSSAPTLEIFGKSAIVVQADRAEVYVQIENADIDVAVAKEKSIDQFNTAKDSLIASGVGPDSIKITSLTTNPNYDYSSNKTLVGYYAILNFSFKLDDLSIYEKSLDSLLDAGIADVNYINFMLSNADEIYQTALREAVNNATLNAQNLLGKDSVTVLKIEEQSSFYAPILYRNHSLDSSLDTSIEISATVKIKCK